MFGSAGIRFSRRLVRLGPEGILLLPTADLFLDPSIRNAVLDFSGTDVFGSSALGFLVVLGRLVKGRHGQLALCNLSDHEREVLKVTRLDRSWPIYSSRQQALRAVSG